MASTVHEPFRLSVTQYHAMRDAGILGEDDRVELLDGILVPKMTKKPPHRLATGLVREELEKIVPDAYYVDSQEPLTTSDSEPEPDVYVVRGARRDYVDRHPAPRDVPLVVEVADESLARDQGTKLALYARAGVAQYWVVNVRGRTVEVFRNPQGDAYRERTELHAGQELVVELDGAVIGRFAVTALLP